MPLQSVWKMNYFFLETVIRINIVDLVYQKTSYHIQNEAFRVGLTQNVQFIQMVSYFEGLCEKKKLKKLF